MRPTRHIQSDSSTTMLLTLVVWACTLPLIAFFVLPFFGLKVAGLLAVGLLIALLVICWALCAMWMPG